MREGGPGQPPSKGLAVAWIILQVPHEGHLLHLGVSPLFLLEKDRNKFYPRERKISWPRIRKKIKK